MYKHIDWFQNFTTALSLSHKASNSWWTKHAQIILKEKIYLAAHIYFGFIILSFLFFGVISSSRCFLKGFGTLVMGLTSPKFVGLWWSEVLFFALTWCTLQGFAFGFHWFLNKVLSSRTLRKIYFFEKQRFIYN